MSVFGLFMMAAMNGQSLTHLTFVTPALANQEADDIEASELAKAVADQARVDADQAQIEATAAATRAEDLDTEAAREDSRAAQEVADVAAELAREDEKKAKDAMTLALTPHCAAGISTCYSADGSLGIPDLSSLPATAAGEETEGDDGTKLLSVVKPRHFRTF